MSTAIAQHVGLSDRTIQRWLQAGTFPEVRRRRKRRSSFDPYAAYVLSRWEEGCHNGLRLWQEIKTQGYQGTDRMVYRFLVPLRRKERIIQPGAVPQVPLQDFSANEAVWLFARDIADLDELEQATDPRHLPGECDCPADLPPGPGISASPPSAAREPA